MGKERHNYREGKKEKKDTENPIYSTRGDEESSSHVLHNGGLIVEKAFALLNL
jgi:hypothetical protein